MPDNPTPPNGAAELAPWDVDARMLHAHALVDGAEAAREAERAVAVDPVRPAARELRSRLRLAAGDLPGAHADLVEAARRDELRSLLSAEGE